MKGFVLVSFGAGARILAILFRQVYQLLPSLWGGSFLCLRRVQCQEVREHAFVFDFRQIEKAFLPA